MHTLEFVLLLLACSVIAIVALRAVKLPPLLGYLSVGVAIAPIFSILLPNPERVQSLAEFGLVFLMFSVGLEFSLSGLFRMRRLVFGLGAAQMALTITLPSLLMMMLGMSWKVGLLMSVAWSMSSTAITSKLLAERQEFESPHGKEIIAVSLFQDLALPPLLIVVMVIAAGSSEDMGPRLLGALAKVVIVLAVILRYGQPLLAKWFHVVARCRSHELFILNILLLTLGLAYITELAGLSMALGAFLAGLLLAETEYRYQVEADIKPFRDVLLGLFFVLLGARLNFAVVMQNWGVVVLLTVGFMLFKGALMAGLSMAFGSQSTSALRTGIWLSPASEFGFLILTNTAPSGVLSPVLQQAIFAAMLCSMLFAPLLIQSSDRIIRRLFRREWVLESLRLTQIASQSMRSDQGHVILAGYGRNGQAVGRLLEQESIPFIALDLDPSRVRDAAAAGENVVYGDSARAQNLVAAGLSRATALVITFADTTQALKILHHVQQSRPSLPVIVRTIDDIDMNVLLAAGAAEVVPDAFETSLMLASHALVLVGVPPARMIKRIRHIREARYGLLKGVFQGASDVDELLHDTLQPRLSTVSLVASSFAVGRCLEDLQLDIRFNVSVTVVRRGGHRILSPSGDTQFVTDDVLVLLGETSQLSVAESYLHKGE